MGTCSACPPFSPPSKLKAPSQNRPVSGRAQSHEVLWPSPTLPSLRSPEISSTAAITRAAPNSLTLVGSTATWRSTSPSPSPRNTRPSVPSSSSAGRSSGLDVEFPLRHSANSALSIRERTALQWDQESTRRARPCCLNRESNRRSFVASFGVLTVGVSTIGQDWRPSACEDRRGSVKGTPR
jgi:hypothetical protein